MSLRHPVVKLGLLVLMLPSCAQSVSWRADYQAALQEARDKDRPLLLDFRKSHCIWCEKLDATTLRDPAVIETLNERFVAVKVDAEQSAALAQSLGIDILPTLIIVNPQGQELVRQVGYVEAGQLRQQLQQALDESPADNAPAERLE